MISEDSAATNAPATFSDKAKHAVCLAKIGAGSPGNAMRAARQCEPEHLSETEWGLVAAFAAREGSRTDLRRAAERCGDIDQAGKETWDKEGWQISFSLLHYVSTHENKRVSCLTQELLDLGANPNARGPQGQTILAAVANSGELSVFSSLLALSDANAQDDAGGTALMACAGSGSHTVDELQKITDLLAAGANPNLTDQHGETALMIAVRARNNAKAKRLVGQTNLSIKNNERQTAADIAIQFEEWALLDDLCASMSPQETAEVGRSLLQKLMPKGAARIDAHHEAQRLQSVVEGASASGGNAASGAAQKTARAAGRL